MTLLLRSVFCVLGEEMRTVWLDPAGEVKMIDQRALPLTLEIVAYRDYRSVAEAISTMVVRGAPAIGAAAAFGMALAARQSRAASTVELVRELADVLSELDAIAPLEDPAVAEVRRFTAARD